MVLLAELESLVNIWMTEQHISSKNSALDCHSVTYVKYMKTILSLPLYLKSTASAATPKNV